MTCNHHHDHDHHDHDCCEESLGQMSLVLEDDTELTCDVIGIFSISEDSETEYIALLPEDNEDILLYRYNETEDGISLENIDSEEEYDEVTAAFEELFLDDEDIEDCDELKEI